MRFSIILRAIILFALLLSFAYVAYVLVIQREGDTPLPPLFGNFPANRAYLEKYSDEGEFTFAVVGDTKSIGTFELITAELRKTPINFAVLLGDCAYGGSEDEHRYFRAECAEEYSLPVPVFYVVGNHDVNPVKFPFKRFEEVYGPGIFKFEYRKCLFIVLRILDTPYSNEESLAFLEQLRNVDRGKYKHMFVFMHVPPPVSPFFKARPYVESERLVSLFDELGIDYVFAGDFHGFAECRRAKTTYIVTGGGGSNLDEKPANQFHHATIIRVAQDSVDKRIIYVPKAEYLEDRLERFAIINAWPWMKRYIALAIALNVLGIACFVLLIRSLIRDVKRSKNQKEVA